VRGSYNFQLSRSIFCCRCSRDSVTRLRMDIIDSKCSIWRMLGCRSMFFIPFWYHFHVLFRKLCALAVSHSTVTLRLISNNHRSFSYISAVHMWSFFNGYVTPWMKNSSLMLLTGWLLPFFLTSCDQNSNFRLLDLSASDHWSPMRNCGCYTSFAELLSYEKPFTTCFLEFNIKRPWKELKMCSGYTKFFWSVFWYQL
jgi:hypothetical protein